MVERSAPDRLAPVRIGAGPLPKNEKMKKKKKKIDWIEDLWEIYKKFDKEMKKFVTVVKLKDLMEMEKKE